MTADKLASLIGQHRIPQIAVARMANVNVATVSLYLRGLCEVSERVRDDLVFVTYAMLEIADESPTPIDWRQAAKLKPLVDTKVAEYRRARTAELRRRFEEGGGTVSAVA